MNSSINRTPVINQAEFTRIKQKVLDLGIDPIRDYGYCIKVSYNPSAGESPGSNYKPDFHLLPLCSWRQVLVSTNLLERIYKIDRTGRSYDAGSVLLVT